MDSEKLLVLLANQLHEKAKEIQSDAGTGTHFDSRAAEIRLCREIISELGITLDKLDWKLSREHGKTTGLRTVWQLWTKRTKP